MKKLFSISAVARELGVTPPAVSSWIQEGKIEPPELEGGASKLYTREQFERIRKWRKSVTSPASAGTSG